MANFNPKDYEEVKDRIKRFYEDHPDGRIITDNLTTSDDRAASTWVMKALVFLDGDELARGTVKATGHAFEVDSAKGVNATSAMENCETSAIGRALANAGYSGAKRPSREEMEKVERNVKPAPVRNWMGELTNVTTRDAALQLYNEARTRNVPKEILDAITEKGKALAAPEVNV